LAGKVFGDGYKIEETYKEKASYFDFYGKAWEELTSKSYDDGVWSRAYIKADGNEKLERLWYIRFRVNDLSGHETLEPAMTAGDDQSSTMKSNYSPPVNVDTNKYEISKSSVAKIPTEVEIPEKDDKAAYVGNERTEKVRHIVMMFIASIFVVNIFVEIDSGVGQSSAYKLGQIAGLFTIPALLTIWRPSAGWVAFIIISILGSIGSNG
jgi:hypothetical protein